MSVPRILVADDRTVFTPSLRSLLEGHAEILTAAADSEALAAAAERFQPEIVLMDVSQPALDRLDAARELKRRAPNSHLVILTWSADAASVIGSLRAGASGYLLKATLEEELLVAVRQILKGGTYVTPSLPREIWESLNARQSRPGSVAAEISAREREVLRLVAEGHSAKEIAAMLHVSSRTVEFHKYRMMRKLGFRSSAQLATYAVQHGLLES